MIGNQLFVIDRETLFMFKFKPYHLLFGLNPFLLISCHQSITTHSVLKAIEFVNNNAYKKVQDENIAYDYKGYEVYREYHIVVVLWLFSNVDAIDSFVHDVKPTLCSDRLV